MKLDKGDLITVIISTTAMITGIICIFISVFSVGRSKTSLIMGLAFVNIGNAINMIRIVKTRKQQDIERRKKNENTQI